MPPQSESLYPAYEKLAQELQVVPLAEQALAEAGQAIADLGLAVEEVTTEPALSDALAAGNDAALIYLYCHVQSVAPGGQPSRPGSANIAPGVASTRIVLTSGANGLTLRDLQLAARLGRALLLRGGPLVVLNACASADLSPLTYEGLAPYLLDQGARAVLAPSARRRSSLARRSGPHCCAPSCASG